jgi:hypothetical protein
MTRRMTALGLIAVLGVAIAACRREAPSEVQGPAGAAPTAVEPAPRPGERVELEDVVETAPGYIIGISYPDIASKYPGLAAELQRYAERARAEVIEAAKQREATPGAPLYDLTLTFTGLVDSPTLVAVAADGSRYTGGAHGEPLVARFVWLPQENRLLAADELVPDPAGWKAIAHNVREQLYTALSQRVDADAMPPEDRAQLVRNTGNMIEQGAAPDAKHFAMFEPVMTPQGTIGALRFVFPPYRVGPYSDGTQTVEVPAHVLLPHVAPQYRRLFAGAAG